MSVNPPPLEQYDIYNPLNFPQSTISPDIERLYLKKAGDIASGLISFNLGLNSNADIRASNGTESAPIYTFKDDLTTGMYYDNPNLVFSTNATDALTLTPTKIILNKSLEPAVDNTIDLGATDKRINTLWASTGSYGALTDITKTIKTMDFDGDGIKIRSALFFPTTGGTPTSFNYFEEADHITTFSGVWADPQSATIKIRKVNALTFISIPEILVNATTSALLVSDVALPTRFRPSASRFMTIVVRDNGADVYGILDVRNDGILRIHKSINFSSGTFTNLSGLATVGTTGWQSIAAEYINGT